MYAVKYRGDLKALEEYPLFPKLDGTTVSKQSARLPSVTTILSETEPPENVYRLMLWRRHMIDKMGFERFQEYQSSKLVPLPKL